MNIIEKKLFETQAMKVANPEKPFWYTSGKIGPYFINTHFVYGNEKDAVELLSFIDDCLSDKLTLPEKVFEKSFHALSYFLTFHCGQDLDSSNQCQQITGEY